MEMLTMSLWRENNTPVRRLALAGAGGKGSGGSHGSPRLNRGTLDQIGRQLTTLFYLDPLLDPAPTRLQELVAALDKVPDTD